ncbi:hypothetical protein FF38_00759 [Lucilia cuprina]|uniref:C-type lectin domain-containing protein n=1 Tax=Lucilia cuprina TaxID=7375 RepID=A0A0L0BTT3_LUCCU|nr:C-type lectin 37Da [Lucilia cuprina]KNC23388.1 hypothetical protein FF38_00759 [Lucilia cuprina]
MALNFKIFALTLSLVLFYVLALASGQTTITTTTIGEKNYRVVTYEKVNWYRAYQLCALAGMQLASIESESEAKALSEFLFANSLLFNNYWLAGNNLANRGEYVWLSSGNRLSYTKWADNQPGTLANRCIRTNAELKWITEPCSNANYYICSSPTVPDCLTGECKLAFE